MSGSPDTTARAAAGPHRSSVVAALAEAETALIIGCRGAVASGNTSRPDRRCEAQESLRSSPRTKPSTLAVYGGKTSASDSGLSGLLSTGFSLLNVTNPYSP